MRRHQRLAVLIASMIGCTIIGIVVATTSPGKTRTSWTLSRVQGYPSGSAEFHLQPIAELSFQEPIDHVLIPERRESLVLEREGGLLVMSSTDGVKHQRKIADFQKPVFAIEVSPDFSVSGHVFVTIADVTRRDKQSPQKLRTVVNADSQFERVNPANPAPAPPCMIQVRRFRMNPDTLTLDDNQGELVIEWSAASSERHVGGAMAFDQDGYLIVATGDGGDSRGLDDSYEIGQSLTDLRGKLLRLNVGRPTGSSSIVEDNPYVGMPDARGEIYGIGFRNPWKIAVDPASFEVYVFNVGEDLWETVYRIGRKMNAGWPLFEGTHPFRTGGKFSSLADEMTRPVIEHSHSECRAIVGGTFYTGTEHSELAGHLLYGDYSSGTVFSSDLKSSSRVLARSAESILEISTDADGEPLFFSQSGRVFRMERASPSVTPFPEKLSETGLFVDLAAYKLAPGVIDYEVNSPLFSDGADKQRHLALPQDAKIGFSLKFPWTFPNRTVLVKTFSAAGRRLETRLMHYEEGQWLAYSYRWNDEQSEAHLVDVTGDRFSYRTAEGHEATWSIPSRTECMMCHTFGAGFVLGVNTLQLNRVVERSGKKVNQLVSLENAGLFLEGLPRKSRLRGFVQYLDCDSFPRLANPADESTSIPDRAISYLHANCAHCHRYLGGGASRFSLDVQSNASGAQLVEEKPIHGDFGIEGACLVAPGNPDQSILLTRMIRDDSAHMPKVGVSRTDDRGIALVKQWIRELPARPSPSTTP